MPSCFLSPAKWRRKPIRSASVTWRVPVTIPPEPSSFFRMLDDGTDSGRSSFLSTHPTDKKHMERMQKEYQKLKTGTKSLGDIAADFTQDDKKREEAKEKTKKGFDFLKGKTKKVLEGK